MRRVIGIVSVAVAFGGAFVGLAAAILTPAVATDR